MTNTNRMISQTECRELLGPEHSAWMDAFNRPGYGSSDRGPGDSFAKQLNERLVADAEAASRIKAKGLHIQYFAYLCEYWFIA